MAIPVPATPQKTPLYKGKVYDALSTVQQNSESLRIAFRKEIE